MGLLVLLGCVSLWAGLALAEVGSSFSNCQEYLYKAAEPEGFDTKNTAKICQKHNKTYHFATLYDKKSRTPRWSAYTLNGQSCDAQPHRKNTWFVEPQLLDQSKSPDMSTESKSNLTLPELKSTQAINMDYEDTNYDRGHLNPNSFQCDRGRTATFTLTNAVPMDPCFNRIHWGKLEKSLKDKLKTNCLNVGGTAYLVTGAVAGPEKIPKESEDTEVDRERSYDRVAVPSHIWTAVCCDHANNNRKFSFAFLAENKEESKLRVLPVEQLNRELQELYPSIEVIRILADDCNAEGEQTQVVIALMRRDLYRAFQDLVTNLFTQVLPPSKRKRLDKETTQVMKSRNVNQRKVQLGSVGLIQEVDSTKDWHDLFLNVYWQDSLSCVLSLAADANGLARTSDTSNKVCSFQEQKHVPGSDISASGWRCFELACGKHTGTSYSWCYTSWDKDWDYCCTEKCTDDYKCARGDGKETTCSPQYSTVTVTGKPCRPDFPCGLYDKNYFWCYTDYKANWEYCCSPHHYCGYHDQDYLWCYVGAWDNNWQSCTL